MKKSKDTKRVGIWLRVSTEDQAKGESLEHHEIRARTFAEGRGWTVVEVYQLGGVSGKNVMEHAETKRMLADVTRKHIGGLVFSKIARLARNVRQLLEIRDHFQQHGAELFALDGDIDLGTSSGNMLLTVKGALAEWERAEIAERVAASVATRAKLGKPLGGAAPFGYQWKDKRLVMEEEEAPVLKLMFELFQKHKKKKTVARMLNEQGFRTRSGAPFSDTTVDRLLQDSCAKGLRRSNYTSSTDNRKAWVLKPKEEWVYHEVPAVVPAELWDEVNAILGKQKETGKRPTRTTVHVFAGVTFCECGQKMYVPSNSLKYTCQKCRNKIPADDLDAVFHEQLRGFVFNADEIARHLEAGNADISEKADLIRVLEAEQGKLAAESDKLYSLYQAGALDVEGFGKRNKPIAERLKQLDDEIPRRQAEIAVGRIALRSQEGAMAEAQNLFTHWPELSQSDKRRVVETITEKIIIGKGEVEISLLYDPPHPPLTPPTNDPAPPSASRGSHDKKATHGQGFIAAINWKPAGNSA